MNRQTMLRAAHRALGGFTACLVASSLACESADSVDPSTSRGSGGAAQAGTGGGLAIGGEGGRGEFDGENCGADRYAARRLPLDLLLMLDRSGSMSEAVGLVDGELVTKWGATATALERFLAEGDTAELRLALQVFPADNGAPNTCTAVDQCLGPAGQDWGPCDVPRACDDGSGELRSCTDSTDCLGDASCRPVGFCDDPTYACFPYRESVCEDTAGACNEPPFGCQNRECDVIDYATPAQDLKPASRASESLVGFMRSVEPAGLTPTAPALRGAVEWASAHAAANPDRVVAILFATDGAPTEWSCDRVDIDDVIDEVATAALDDGFHLPVFTYTLGVYAPDQTEAARARLDEIARAGATDEAIIVALEEDTDLSAVLAEAFDGIRQRALPCVFELPETTATRLLYEEEVNLEFRPTGGTVDTIPYVADAYDADGGVDSRRACGEAGGWHYDVDPSDGDPTRIIACPATCDALRADATGEAQVSIGCPTVLR